MSLLRMLFCLALSVVSQAAWAESPELILQKADEVRNPSDSFSMIVDIKTKGQEDSRFEVLIKGKERTLVRTKKPARDVGRNMLMVEEDMWVYIPNLKRAVRVSLSQKLSGQAANGDISRMRWHGDYKADLDKETDEHWILDLQANKKGLTYDRIRVWVSKKGFKPARADYLTKRGKMLKRATFGAYKMILGAERPTEILIQDANDRSKMSKILIRKMNSENFPSSLFHQNSLK